MRPIISKSHPIGAKTKVQQKIGLGLLQKISHFLTTS
jgi:hypothetical protein